MKTNKQIVAELKKVLANTRYKVYYRNRDGKEYVRITTKYSPDLKWETLKKIVLAAFPNAICTSGSVSDKTFRVN